MTWANVGFYVAGFGAGGLVVCFIVLNLLNGRSWWGGSR